MASGTEHAHIPVPTCIDHKQEEVFYFCKTCQKRICEKCVKGGHSEHDWTVIMKHARELRMEGQQISDKLRQEVIAPLKEKRSKKKKGEERAKVRLTQQRMKTALLGAIDEYADELVSQLDEDEDTTDLDREIDEFEKFAVFFEKHVKIEYDSVVVETVEELHVKLRQHRTSKLTAEETAQRFQEGTINKDIIKSMMGRVQKVQKDQSTMKLDVKVERTIQHGSQPVMDISVKSEENAWIHSSKSKQSCLIDKTGKEIEKRNYETVFDQFTIKGSEHIFTYAVKQCINRLSNDTVSTICSTVPLYPTGICQTRVGGLLVCLTDCCLSDITPSSKGDIQEMDLTGRITKIYNHDSSDHTKLFTWPCRVVQNMNSDLCVSDILNTARMSRLVVVTEDSRIRFTYKGQSSLKEKFTLQDVACDLYGRIILCDLFNNAIHMLSADGKIIQFLLTSQNRLREPTALAVYGNNMWVGCANGVIHLCTLKRQS